jgi:isoleucyl-tRNA synthetase
VGIGPDDVVVTETPREGWAVVTEAGESVALDLALDDELRRAGVAREVVRTIQEGRKAAGLDVSDRIRVWWSSDDGEVAAAVAEHADTIGADVLAVEFAQGVGPDGAHVVHVAEGLAVGLQLLRA